MEKVPLEDLRRKARLIFGRAVSAVDPSEKLKEILRLDQDRFFVRTGHGSEEFSI